MTGTPSPGPSTPSALSFAVSGSTGDLALVEYLLNGGAVSAVNLQIQFAFLPPPNVLGGNLDVFVSNGFKVALLQGVHNFSVGGDTFKLALYGQSISIPPVPPAYTPLGEVSGPGYTAGGAVLTNVSPTLVDGVAVATFNNVVFSSATFTARYALIYNASKANVTVVGVNFGQPYTVSGGNLQILMPPANATNAIIRVT